MNTRVVEIRAFVPALGYALSVRFDADMGFTLTDTSGALWRIAESVRKY